jgi:hypothetical protein
MKMITGLCAMLSLAACSDFTSSGDPLTPEEAGVLAGNIVGQSFPGFGGVEAAPAAAPAVGAAPADRITITISESGSCDGGGTATVAGSLVADVNQEARTGTLEYDFTLAPSGCVVMTEGGKTFTLTGDPNLKGEGKLNWSQTSFEGALKYSGKFSWVSSDGREGVCGVDLEANFDFNTGDTGSNASASLSGTVCGASISRTVEVET